MSCRCWAPARYGHDDASCEVARAERRDEATADRLPLEACICGEHFECPDDWHWGEDLPCACTPDCALDAPDLRGWTEAEARAAWGDR